MTLQLPCFSRKVKQIYHSAFLQQLRCLSSNMNQIHHKISPYPVKGFLDDSSSQTSSTVTYRLTRRQDEKSSSRRSISRNSSDRSMELLDLSRFYVKMSPTAQEKEGTPTRRSIIDRIEDSPKDKKRTPTPLPGHCRKIQSEKYSNCSEQIETDLLIAQLQRKYSDQKSAKETLQRRLVLFEREIKSKLTKIEQLQRQNAQSLQREQVSSKKLQEYQSIVQISESNLNDARNKLEKLKNTIKQNRYAQLEFDNNRLKLENKSFKQDLQSLQLEIKRNLELISSLENESTLLRTLNMNLTKESRLEQKNREIEELQKIIQSSKSEKEQELERFIQSSKKERRQLTLKVDKLEIRLNYLNRKKNEEIEKMRQSKNQVITKLRTKISNVYTQYNNLRIDYDKLNPKGTIYPSLQSSRKNAFLDETRSNEDHILFDLSP